MARWLALALAALFAGSSGCKCGARPGGEAVDAAAAAAPVDAAALVAASGPSAIFSAPIAGARVPGGEAIAAGLVVGAHAIVAARVDATGHAVWTRPIVPNVAWSSDAELHAWPIAAGAAVVWRGPIGGKSGHVAVVLGPDGRVLDGPLEVGSLVCATDDGIAWTEPAPAGGSRVHLRSWPTGGPPHDDVGPVIADELTLTCGGHRAYAVVEGDEGSPTRVFAMGGGAQTAPLVTIAPMALGRDEERDLFAWAEGDELGLLRIATAGAVEAADVRMGEIALLHAERARVLPEDDVVAVDADAREVVLVTTHDESDACPEGRGGSSVHALRIPRRSGVATSLEIAKGGCGKDAGPFWMSPLGRSLMVGWAERSSRLDKSAPPIAAIAYRLLEEGSTTGRLAQPADAVADAGCDGTRCFAVALVRDVGADGMKPGSIKVLSYP